MPAAEEAFNKITSVAQKRLTFSDVTHKFPEISENIPETYDSMVHRYHNQAQQAENFCGLRGQEEIDQFTKQNQPDQSWKERLWSACPSFY